MYLVVWGLLREWGCGSGNDCGFFRLLKRLSEIKICEENFGKAISFLMIRNYMTYKK
jgi:hypothetical protein